MIEFSLCLFPSEGLTGSTGCKTWEDFSRSPMALVSDHLSDNVYSGLVETF